MHPLPRRPNMRGSAVKVGKSFLEHAEVKASMPTATMNPSLCDPFRNPVLRCGMHLIVAGTTKKATAREGTNPLARRAKSNSGVTDQASVFLF
jgi:hypothetical protein